MNPDSLQTSFWVMVLVQTIGSVDMPGRGARKMPAPRQYVAILVAWLILELFSGIGENTKRAATSIGWALVLAGLVVGPFGQRLSGFLQTIAHNFPAVPSSNASASTTTTSGNVTA